MVFLVFTDSLPRGLQDVQGAGIAEISGIVTAHNDTQEVRGDRGKGPAMGAVRHYPTALSLPGH